MICTKWRYALCYVTGCIPYPNKEDTVVNKGFSREQIERVARMYKCNQDASRALGITIRSFSRLCRKHDIESPFARRQRQHRQAAQSTNNPI